MAAGKMTAQPAAAQTSILDAALEAAASAWANFYRKTARGISAIGLAMSPEAFTRAVVIAVERKLVPGTVEELEAQGWIDVEHPDGFKLRIANAAIVVGE